MNAVTGNRNSGFTLIEMLIAMALIAVLSGSLYASFSIGFKAKNSSESAMKPVNAAGITFKIMGSDIVSTPPPSGILAGPFIGDEASLVFYTRPMSSAEAAPGIIRVEYKLVPADENDDFVVMRYVTVNLLSPEQIEAQGEIICRNVRSMEIRYSDGAQWLETWDSSGMGNILPSAVEVSVEVNLPDGTEGNYNIRRFERIFVLPCAAPLTEEITV